MTYIPYSCQTIEEDDIAAVAVALRQPYLTQGGTIAKFEESISQYVQSADAVACSSATAALTIAYRALGIGPGSLVWTVPNSFVATANAALYCGANIDFVDIEPGTWNISVEALRKKLHLARERKALPSLLVPVHFAGASCDMRSIATLAQEFGFKVIEDAAHALGGTYNNKPIGCCEFSNAAVFSFHPVKSITTGEGGMVVTNDGALAQTMAMLRTHGITRDKVMLANSDEGGWYYEQQVLGWHFRLTDFQAALGISQLAKLARYINRRKEIATRYISELSSEPIVSPSQGVVQNSALHLFVIHLAGLSKYRREIFDILRAAEIGVNVHYIPIHLQPFYQNLGFSRGMFPEAERYYDGAISLPIYPLLTSEQQTHVIHTLKGALSRVETQ